MPPHPPSHISFFLIPATVNQIISKGKVIAKKGDIYLIQLEDGKKMFVDSAFVIEYHYEELATV